MQMVAGPLFRASAPRGIADARTYLRRDAIIGVRHVLVCRPGVGHYIAKGSRLGRNPTAYCLLWPFTPHSYPVPRER